LPQLVKQPRILDGDNCLCREIGDQFDLLVGECADLQAVDGDRTDHVVLLKHRHAQETPCAGRFDKGNYRRSTLDISLVLREIRNMLHRLGSDDSRERNVWKTSDMNHGLTLAPFNIRRRRIVHRADAEPVSLAKLQIPELCAAQARRILQDRIENRLQLSR
jgi:hypothetical protein